jgi:hypothetical protein
MPFIVVAMSLSALTVEISKVTVSLVLTKIFPVRRMPTMTLDQVTLSSGSAVAVSVPFFCLAVAAMVWWRCPRVVAR